jgi:hypothetical protein
VPGHDLGLDALMQLVHGFSMLAQLPAIRKRDIMLDQKQGELSRSFKAMLDQHVFGPSGSGSFPFLIKVLGKKI